MPFVKIDIWRFQIRKQQKNHTELIEDYRTKQQQRTLQQPSTSSPPIMHQKLSQPVGGPTPSHTPNITASWASGGGAPGVFAQRVPPMALPDPPQPPSHRQTPGFTTGTQGPTGGPGGRPTPCQVVNSLCKCSFILSSLSTRGGALSTEHPPLHVCSSSHCNIIDVTCSVSHRFIYLCWPIFQFFTLPVYSCS